METLLGDPSNAKKKLGWTPKITLAELVAEMVNSDYTAAKRDSLVKIAAPKLTITTNRELKEYTINYNNNVRHIFSIKTRPKNL